MGDLRNEFVAKARAEGVRAIVSDLRSTAQRHRSIMEGDWVRLDAGQSWVYMDAAADLLDALYVQASVPPKAFDHLGNMIFPIWRLLGIEDEELNG